MKGGHNTTASPPAEDPNTTSDIAAVVIPLVVGLIVVTIVTIVVVGLLCLFVRVFVALEAPICMVSWRKLRRIQHENRPVSLHIDVC